MKTMNFGDAIDDALAQAMAEDPRVLIIGEDVHGLRRALRIRFGRDRILTTPISEGAFVGAAVAAAMAGLRPVVEVMLVDFIAVASDALLNHAAKVRVFSGNRWSSPVVVRAACGGGYGDGGQHEQCLWGWLAHIPGMAVAVPSNPADAGGLMTAALRHDDPVIFLEHKLLAGSWLDAMGVGGRPSVRYDVPAGGARGAVPARWESVPFGEAVVRRPGSDVAMISLGVGVHRALEAARKLEEEGISSEVVDLRTVAPLDREAIFRAGAGSGRVLAIDEDYLGFGLSGEIAAVLLEGGFRGRFSRVCTEGTIPFSLEREAQALPNVDRILRSVRELVR